MKVHYSCMRCLEANLRRQTFLAALTFALLTAAPGSDPAAQPAWAEKICSCAGCLVVQNEQSLKDSGLEEEVKSLVETLAIRLGKKGIMVMARLDGGERRVRGPKGDDELVCNTPPEEQQWFIVHLQDLSEDTLLVAFDYLGSRIEDDMVRQVEKGPNPAATAWTLALMLEDALAPYLEASKDSPAIGAGLALIEPFDVVGASSLEDFEQPEEEEDSGPAYFLADVSFHAVSLGVSSAYWAAASDLVFGPRVSVSLNLGSRFRASLSGGWLGLGQIEKEDIKVSIHQIPLELIMGAVFPLWERVELSVLGGISTGLIMYDASGENSNSRKTVFSPSVSVRAEVIVQIFGPLWAGGHVGGAVTLIRDELVSEGARLYRQDWAMPLVGIDLVYRLP